MVHPTKLKIILALCECLAALAADEEHQSR